MGILKMANIAFLYAGQGSQITGMGKDLYETFPEFKAVFDNASLEFDLKEMCFSNPENRLNETHYTQPCMVAFGCGVTDVLKNRGVKPDFVCGLSLGEYSALYAAGVWNLEETMRIISFRGKVMAEASVGIDSAMAAIIGLEPEAVEQCCKQAASIGIVSICNLNCPRQIVIGGEKEAVNSAMSFAKASGAKRCLSLPVSGPFHTSFMRPAAKALESMFKKVRFNEPSASVLYNVLGGSNIQSEPIANLLVRQVMSPVKMQMCIEALFGAGIDTFIEIGPGTALSGFVKRTAKQLGVEPERYRLFSINTASDIEALLSVLAS